MARYMYPDINGNQLQCYAWGLGTPTDGGDSGGGGGGGGEGYGDSDSDGDCRGCRSLCLIIHVDKNYRVVLPVMITAKKDFVVQANRGIIAGRRRYTYWQSNVGTYLTPSIAHVTVTSRYTYLLLSRSQYDHRT